MDLREELSDWKMGMPLLAECGRLYHRRLTHRIPVSQPLILISQIQRSGGTLLSQLFDSHPQCHAHPHELHIGHPKKYNWPILDLNASPKTWFSTLREKHTRRAFRHGYQKYGTGADQQKEYFPFLAPPRLQRLLFLACVEQAPIKNSRDILNCYMTSYFNAWLDNQNLYGGDKRVVTAFAAGLNRDETSVKTFFQDYTDGRLISIVRDPRSWYASARKHKELYGDMENAISMWRDSTQASLRAYSDQPERVHLLSFEDLVANTEGTMRALAAAIGIDFLPQLLTPTFNGFPIKADSSYKVQDYGVIKEPLTRYKKVLSAEEMSYIEEQALPLFEESQSLKMIPVTSS